MVVADRVVVELEARTAQYERNLKGADRTMRTNMRNVESHAERMRKRVDMSLARVGTGAFRNLIVGATAALAPILSVGAALRTAHSALQDFDKLGTRASMFGVDVEWLQEMRYAAEQGGMAVDNFDTALRRFVRRSSEAALGTGAAKGAFKELGIALHDAGGQMKSSEALLREVADAMQRVPNQADKLRLAFQMFDTDGAAMVNVLADGSAGLDEFARKARELGIVIDREMVARAQDLKSELDTATRVLNTQFQQALVDIAPILISTAQLVGSLAGAIASVADAMRDVENKTSKGLNTRLEELRGMLAEERAYVEDLQRRGPAQWNVGGQNLMQSAREREQSILAQLRQVESEIFRRADQQSMATLPRPIPDGAILPETPETRNKAAEAAVKQAEAVARLIENLKHERDQLGRTAEEQELYNLLKAAGVERESEYGQAIEAALGPLQDQRAAIEANAEAMKLLEDAANNALNTIIDGFLDGKDAGEIFGDVLRDIGRQLISMGVSGLSGGFANLFNPLGGLFGGFRANGGPVSSGRSYIVGERGPELFTPSSGGRITANHDLGGGGANVTFAPQIDARGADVAAVARLEEVIIRQQAEFDGRVKQIVSGANRNWRPR